ncbi:MAG: ceramidase domain-containing protein [Dermatophilaceae bacterium]
MSGYARRTSGDSFTPVVVTLAVGIAGVVLVVLATAYGWLGPDVDRGAGFCETDHWCFFAQPSNTLSNLAFVAAGTALAWHARRPSGRLEIDLLAVPFTVIVALLGPGSMAMHATETDLGGHLDVLSMHLLAGFAASYAVARIRGWDAGRTVVLFALLVGLGTAASLSGGSVPVVRHPGNAFFALLLLVAVVGEAVLLRRRAIPPWWGVASVTVLLVAFAIWLPSQTGRAWCIPESWLQGHALWHVLCAVAAYLLGRHYTARAPAG